MKNEMSAVFPLSDETLDILLQRGNIAHWPKGALLLKEGEKCRHVHFIKKGLIKAFQTKDGRDINLHFYFEHTFATNLKSLRTEFPSEYQLQAMEALETWSISKTDLLQLYTISPEIESCGKSLLESLLIQQEEHAAFFKLYSPEERYHYLLLHKPVYIQRLPLSQLASYLGMTRESLSRIRKRLT